MSIIRQISWTEQPQVDVGVDWTNPMSSGLLFLAPLNPVAGLRDLVRGQQLTRTGALSPAASRNGIYPTFAASNYLDLPSVPAVGTTSPATIAWTQEPRATSAYSALLQINFGSGTSAFLIYQSAADANYYFNAGPHGGNSIQFGASTGAVTNGVLDRYVLQVKTNVLSRSAAGYTLWRNGVPLTGVGGSATGNFAAMTAAVARIGASSTGSDPFEGLIGNLHIWGRSLTDAEASAWSSPGGEFSLLAPRTQRIWVPVSASGSYTLTADNGAYSINGQPASITKTKVLNAAQGTYSIAGQAATITYTTVGGYTLVADKGDYTYTGQTATLKRSKLITANNGTYSIAGQNATVAYSGSNTVTLKAGSWIRYRIIT